MGLAIRTAARAPDLSLLVLLDFSNHHGVLQSFTTVGRAIARNCY